MNRHVKILGGFIGVGLALALGSIPSAVHALEVVACMYDSTTVPRIGDDPNACPADQKLNIVSVRTSWADPSTTGSSSGGAAPNVQEGPFVLAKRLDRTSPGLFLALATRQLLGGVLVVMYDQRVGLRVPRLFSILIENAVVVSIEASGADGSADSLELVGFKYAKITLRDDVSGRQTSWNFVTHGPN